MDLELVDEEIITQMIEDTSADVIPILIDHYLEESKTRIEILDQAFSDKNFETLEFETHTLGSSSLALGNRTLSELARKIEHLCLQGKGDQAIEFHQSLLDLAKRSLAALEHRKSLGFVE